MDTLLSKGLPNGNGPVSLAERLKQARLSRNLTLEQVAEALDTSYPTIWRYEAGQRNPSGPTLHALAALYERPMDWFFGEGGEPYWSHSIEERMVAEAKGSTDKEYVSFMGLQGELTPEEALEVRNFIEYTLAKREQRKLREDD